MGGLAGVRRTLRIGLLPCVAVLLFPALSLAQTISCGQAVTDSISAVGEREGGKGDRLVFRRKNGSE